MDTAHDIALEWSDIDGEGLVRVFPVSSFKTGFVMAAHIGLAAEKTNYYPEVLLSPTKVVVTIPPDSDGLDRQLALGIDEALHDAASQS